MTPEERAEYLEKDDVRIWYIGSVEIKNLLKEVM